MGKKWIVGVTLILTVCFFVLGFVFKATAQDHKGITATTGVVINGEFVESTSGNLGGNSKSYEMFDSCGTTFYVLGGITGVICIIALVKNRKSA